jgi:hypothetical protein
MRLSMSKSFIILLLAMSGWSLLFARARFEDYALVLRDEPVAARIRARKELQSAPARRQAQVVATAQTRLRTDLARRGIAITGSVRILANAVFVRVPVERAAELRSLAGVKFVQRLPRMHRHLDQAVQLMGIPDAWNTVGGVVNAGAGVKIGILDTGIDQTHAAFQDPGLSAPAGFPKGDASFTNNKVIVARSYVAPLALGNGTPQDTRPDDLSARDRSGHGTAVAMIAAGEQNAGPLATITGIAPKAWLGNYKVFGSPGVNDFTSDPVVMQALEDAFTDGMDIVVMPFGTQPVYPAFAQDCGGVCDQRDFAIEQAVQNAINNGMTVVISAGNDGNVGSVQPTQNTIHTPGLVPAAITVGATSNVRFVYATVQAGGNNLTALFGDAPPPAQPLTAPLRDAAQACTSLPAHSLDGAIALIQRGNCDYNVKVNNTQAAGAVGAVVYQPAGNDMPEPMLGLTATGIPAVMVANTDGNTLESLIQASPDPPVTIDPTPQSQTAVANVVAAYSSRGPAIGTSAIKPDLVATGAGIYTATESSDPNGDLYNATGYTGVSGTTFAAPMVAGAAALVKQQNGGFSPGQIKSALVNTATQDVTGSSGAAHVTGMGAGKLNAAVAVSAGATVEPATLSFGAITALPVSLTLTLTNTSGAAVTFNLSADSAAIGLSQSSVTLNPGEARQISAQLTGSRPAPGSYEGFVTISGAGTTLKVPYLYLVGDGVPYNIFPVAQGSFIGAPNDTDWLIAFKLIDRYGVPVTSYPVTFHIVSGGGKITQGDPTTDKTGIAGAFVNLGPQPGDQIFNATAGGLTVEFDGYAHPLPVVSGVVDATTGQAGQGLKPGSTATITGRFLSDATKSTDPASPVIQLAGVTVSFDAPGISMPGLLSSVSSGQITVQIPAALAGQQSAQMKVSIGAISSNIVSVPLASQ